MVKYNNDVVAKVILRNKDYTEYTSIKFLAEHVPGIPIPRPHSLIAFGPFRVLFMSYILDIALAQARFNLLYEGKLLIQQQLKISFAD